MSIGLQIFTKPGLTPDQLNHHFERGAQAMKMDAGIYHQRLGRLANLEDCLDKAFVQSPALEPVNKLLIHYIALRHIVELNPPAL